MELKKFKLVSARSDTLWRGKEIQKGICKLVLAGETEEDVKWFFSKIDWTAWVLEQVIDPPEQNKNTFKGKL